MQSYLEPFEKSLAKVNSLMSKLKTLKVSGKSNCPDIYILYCVFLIKVGILREKTKLRPHTRNVTRWLSTFQMVDSYYKLVEFFPHICSKFPDFVDYTLSVKESMELNDLNAALVSRLIDISNESFVALSPFFSFDFVAFAQSIDYICGSDCRVTKG